MGRAKKCKAPGCEKKFTPSFNTTQVVCSPRCSLVFAKQQSELKAEKDKEKEIYERKKKLKPLSKWLKEAQTIFNQYIRLRDELRPCISCGTYTAPQYAAGHYRTVGANPELRFNELNVHRQCNRNCNLGLSGNIIEYRKGLINRIGEDAVNWIEGPHKPKNYTIKNAKTIKKWYQRKIKRLRGGNEKQD